MVQFANSMTYLKLGTASQRSLGKRKPGEEPREILARVFPFERSGALLVAILEGENTVLEGEERIEGVRPEHLATKDRKIDFDLIEPAGVNGQVNEDEIRPAFREALDRRSTTVRRAVVDDPEHALGRGIGLLPHHVRDQVPKGHDAAFRLAAAEESGASHVPGGQIDQCPGASILMLDAHRFSRTRRPARQRFEMFQFLVGQQNRIRAVPGPRPSSLTEGQQCLFLRQGASDYTSLYLRTRPLRTRKATPSTSNNSGQSIA